MGCSRGWVGTVAENPSAQRLRDSACAGSTFRGLEDIPPDRWIAIAEIVVVGRIYLRARARVSPSAAPERQAGWLADKPRERLHSAPPNRWSGLVGRAPCP